MRNPRTVALLGVLLSAAVMATHPAQAQSWPTKPIRVIVPFPPGGGLDFFARLVTARMQESLGQQIIVDNRSGASGMIGAEAVARAAPDGHTVLFSTAAEIAVNQHLYRRMNYDPLKDLAPVSYASHAALLLSVHPSLPAKSLQALIELAKARPGALTYASAGTGSLHHLSGELLKSKAGIDIVHVPYKGAGPAVIDMISGQVAMGFSALPSSLPHARAGRLRPIAVTGTKRSQAAEDLPIFPELGFPDIDVVSWYGVLVPAGTPGEVVARLHAEVVAAMNRPEIRSRLLKQGIEVVGSSPEAFARFITGESRRYAAVIKASGAKLD